MNVIPEERHAAAMRAYRARLRRPRVVHALTLVVLMAAALVTVKIAYVRGEISHATLRTVPRPPRSAPLQPIGQSLLRRWRTADTPAIGTPVAAGTVVTYDAHTVRGRDLLTGRSTWSYTRTDRIVCTAIQVAQVTIAVFAVGDRCDELTAVDTGTGQRRWTRTLFTDGAAFSGPASYSLTPDVVLFVSRTSVYALSPAGSADSGNGGLDYWRFSHPACTITGAVLGSAGALISQICHRPPCAGLIHCAAGPQLLLRPALNPSGDPPANNPDHITWLRPGLSLRPVSAGSPLTALTPDGTALATVSSRDGAVVRTTPLIAPAAPVPPVASPAVPGGGWPGAAPFGVTAGSGTLLWLGADTAYLPSGAATPSWQRATTGPATVATTNTRDMFVAAAGGGAALLASSDGALRRRWPLPTAPGDLVTAAGRGVLVGGPSGTGYYA